MNSPEDTLPTLGATRDDAQPWGPLEVDPERYVERVAMRAGGMGVITSAFDCRLRRRVALKELLEDGMAHRARFEHEALLTARLQHPSIVRVLEVGHWPSGEPFYAMDLVKGEPLDGVLARATTLAGRLALLPRVLAVADAVAYAHAQGIVHRDLKPHNVILGEFGETVVIDWGLAKMLAHDEVAASPDASPPPVAQQTAAGAVLGTPSYMPPEQAQDSRVDPRADVYAIGAILYHLLAGRTPHSGTTQADILDSLRRAPPPSLRALVPRLSPDLCAIVERAMARIPAARYPTARELADDLRRFLAGELVGARRYSRAQRLARWLRQHRGPVVVAAVASVVLGLGLTTSFRRVMTERVLAEHHRAQAEELMSFMLLDLYEKLKPMGKVELLAAVMERARAYYAEGGSDDPARTHRRARALANLADVRAAENDGPSAIVSYRAALALEERIAPPPRADAEGLRVRASLHRRIGEVQSEQRPAQSLGDCEVAITLAATALVLDPMSTRGAQEIIADLSCISGFAGARGNSRLMLRLREAALAVARQHLGSAAPADLDLWSREVALGNLRLGDSLVAAGLPAASAFYESLPILERRAAEDPENVGRQRDLELIRSRLPPLLSAVGEWRGAGEATQAYLALAEQIAAHDPANRQWQRELASAQLALGESLDEDGELSRAISTYELALAILARLAAQDPASARLGRELSEAHQHLGATLTRRGDLAQALAHYQASLALGEWLTAVDPANSNFAVNVAVSHAGLARVRERQEDLEGAQREVVAASAILTRLVGSGRFKPGWLHELATDDQLLGDVRRARGDRRGARLAYAQALALEALLTAAEPMSAPRRLALGVSRGRLAEAWLETGDLDAARAEAQAALDLVARVAALDLSRPSYQHELALGHARLARVLERRGQHASARGQRSLARVVAARLPPGSEVFAWREVPVPPAHVGAR